MNTAFVTTDEASGFYVTMAQAASLLGVSRQRAYVLARSKGWSTLKTRGLPTLVLLADVEAQRQR